MFKNLMWRHRGSLYLLKMGTLVLVIAMENLPLCQGVFKCFSSAHRPSYPACPAPTHGTRMVEFVFLTLLLPSHLFWFGLKLSWIIPAYFSFYPVGSLFQLKGISSLNTFLFGTKLQCHTPVKKKGALIMKVYQVRCLTSPLPHPRHPLPLPHHAH